MDNNSKRLECTNDLVNSATYDKRRGHVTNRDKRIGERLRRERKLRSVTQTMLSKKLGITFQQIQKYERGINRISAGKLEEIAIFLKMSVSEFYEEDVSGTDNPFRSLSKHEQELIIALRALNKDKKSEAKKLFKALIKTLH